MQEDQTLPLLQPAIDAKDFSALKAQYALDQRIRVTNFLTPDSARSLGQHLGALPTTHQACAANNVMRLIAIRDLESLHQEDRARIFSMVYDQAARGEGYWYGRYEPPESGCPVQDALSAWLNSEAMLNVVRTLSGIAEIRRASFQVTRYRSGDFLTRHRDTVASENRRLAYTVNFASHWHPDWGGLLQFYQDDGTPRDAWSPEFNSFGLFDVRHVHAVTVVAPFARNPRLTVSGWFHS